MSSQRPQLRLSSTWAASTDQMPWSLTNEGFGIFLFLEGCGWDTANPGCCRPQPPRQPGVATWTPQQSAMPRPGPKERQQTQVRRSKGRKELSQRFSFCQGKIRWKSKTPSTGNRQPSPQLGVLPRPLHPSLKCVCSRMYTQLLCISTMSWPSTLPHLPR